MGTQPNNQRKKKRRRNNEEEEDEDEDEDVQEFLGRAQEEAVRERDSMPWMVKGRRRRRRVLDAVAGEVFRREREKRETERTWKEGGDEFNSPDKRGVPPPPSRLVVHRPTPRVDGLRNHPHRPLGSGRSWSIEGQQTRGEHSILVEVLEKPSRF